MITISSRATSLALAASLLFAGAAYAQTTTTPAPATAPAAKAQKPRTAASLECSKEADEKGLKGKERKKFRSQCKKEQAAKAAPASK